MNDLAERLREIERRLAHLEAVAEPPSHVASADDADTVGGHAPSESPGAGEVPVVASDGSVTLPGDVGITGTCRESALPAFRATHASESVTYPAGDVVFDAVDFDRHGDYDPSTGMFTAPFAGVYWFKVHFFLYTTYLETDNNYIAFKRNGHIVRTSNFGKRGYDGGFELGAVMVLGAGDTVNVHVRYDVQTWGGNYSGFEGFMVARV